MNHISQSDTENIKHFNKACVLYSLLILLCVYDSSQIIIIMLIEWQISGYDKIWKTFKTYWMTFQIINLMILMISNLIMPYYMIRILYYSKMNDLFLSNIYWLGDSRVGWYINKDYVIWFHSITNELPRFDDISNEDRKLYFRYNPPSTKFISHRWKYRNEIYHDELIKEINQIGEQFIWLDYCCMPQKRDIESRKQLKSGLISMNNKIIDAELLTSTTIKNEARGWIIFEHLYKQKIYPLLYKVLAFEVTFMIIIELMVEFGVLKNILLVNISMIIWELHILARENNQSIFNYTLDDITVNSFTEVKDYLIVRGKLDDTQINVKQLIINHLNILIIFKMYFKDFGLNDVFCI
jgi:hypothetical protein